MSSLGLFSSYASGQQADNSQCQERPTQQIDKQSPPLEKRVAPVEKDPPNVRAVDGSASDIFGSWQFDN